MTTTINAEWTLRSQPHAAKNVFARVCVCVWTVQQCTRGSLTVWKSNIDPSCNHPGSWIGCNYIVAGLFFQQLSRHFVSRSRNFMNILMFKSLPTSSLGLCSSANMVRYLYVYSPLECSARRCLCRIRCEPHSCFASITNAVQFYTENTDSKLEHTMRDCIPNVVHVALLTKNKTITRQATQRQAKTEDKTKWKERRSSSTTQQLQPPPVSSFNAIL